MKKHLLQINLVFFLICFGICSNMYSQDIIIKTNGETVNCFVEEITQTDIRYRKGENLRGPYYRININEVHRIVYENGKVEEFNKLAESPANNSVQKEVEEQAASPKTGNEDTPPVQDGPGPSNEDMPATAGLQGYSPSIETKANMNGITFGLSALAVGDLAAGGGAFFRYERMLGKRFSVGASAYALSLGGEDDDEETTAIMLGPEGRFYFNPGSKFKIYTGPELLVSSEEVLTPSIFANIGFRWNTTARFHLFGTAGLGVSEDYELLKINAGMGFNF
jgi:hypothetical protein